jgi:uncharacterized oligopeptide transporter (OPT) family protein
VDFIRVRDSIQIMRNNLYYILLWMIQLMISYSAFVYYISDPVSDSFIRMNIIYWVPTIGLVVYFFPDRKPWWIWTSACLAYMAGLVGSGFFLRILQVSL